ncbi:MAG: DNA polymerase IV [Clostridiales bacterium]|nr:DNA polymerase IV [Clostridiales bacterium]
MDRIIFHIDVNSAYLSWSALKLLHENPESTDIRTIPAIIGGNRETRHGIVLAKSLPAKKIYHIQTAEPVAQALKKCPSLTIVPPDHQLYSQYSKKFISFLRSLTPEIEQVSIDECFLDYTKIAHRFPDPEAGAAYIRSYIYEHFGFTVNVGISSNKVLAKMASDFEKPNKTHTLFPEEIQSKMWPLPISSLFMAGHASVAVLRKLEIHTIGDLARMNPQILSLHLKSHGRMLWEYANGLDSSPLESEPSQAKGIGNSTTLPKDLTTPQEAYPILHQLSSKVGYRLKSAGQSANNLCVEIKYSTFDKYTRQMPLSSPSQDGETLYRYACKLFDALWNGNPIRLLGVRAGKLTGQGEPFQMDLFSYDPKETEKRQKLDRAMEKIRQKYGKDAIHHGFSDK